MREDAELVNLAVAGDRDAFAELYERYFDRIYDFLARMVRSEAEAADLAQDTFLKAMNSLDNLGKGGSFKSWLFTIARNTALNRLERNSRQQPLDTSLDDDDAPRFDVIDSDRMTDPAEAAEAAALSAYVWEAAAALDPKQYAVLHLNLREGLDSAEIANVMGVTKNNAYVMVNRMKSALHDAFGALVLFRDGRAHCNELDAILADAEPGPITPATRRLIDRHASRCETCGERRRKLSSPFAIFAGFGLFPAPEGAKASILAELSRSYPYGSEQAAGAASGGRGAGPTAPVSNQASGWSWGSLRFKAAAVAFVGALLVAGSALTFALTKDDEPGVTLAQASPTAGSLLILSSPTSDAPPATSTPTAVATSLVQPETPGAPLVTAPTSTPQTQANTQVTQPPPLVAPPTATPCSPVLQSSPAALRFSPGETTRSFELSASGCTGEVAFIVSTSTAWTTAQPAQAQLTPNVPAIVSVTIDRAGLGSDGGEATVLVQAGASQLEVRVVVVPDPTPTPSMTPTPTRTATPTTTPTPSCSSITC